MNSRGGFITAVLVLLAFLLSVQAVHVPMTTSVAAPSQLPSTSDWNTFLGGSGSDYGRNIAIDGNGNIYVTGDSSVTWGGPIRAFTAGSDAYVAKLDASGNLIWNTFLGGSGNDYGFSIALNGDGNIYVSGYSSTTWGAPRRAYSGGEDAFAAKLDVSGNLLWNTFLGGNGMDNARSGAVDGSGNFYVAGYSNATWGGPLRAYTSGLDAFIAKLDSSGNLLWDTFLGGSGEDYSFGICVDTGNVYLAGQSSGTWGTPVRTYTGGYDAFAAKLNSSGSLTWSTFLGGSGDDSNNDIAVDGNGNIYVAGQSDDAWAARCGTTPMIMTPTPPSWTCQATSPGTVSWAGMGPNTVLTWVWTEVGMPMCQVGAVRTGAVRYGPTPVCGTSLPRSWTRSAH